MSERTAYSEGGRFDVRDLYESVERSLASLRSEIGSALHASPRVGARVCQSRICHFVCRLLLHTSLSGVLHRTAVLR